jgi:hypothetical protein
VAAGFFSAFFPVRLVGLEALVEVLRRLRLNLICADEVWL